MLKGALHRFYTPCSVYSWVLKKKVKSLLWLWSQPKSLYITIPAASFLAPIIWNWPPKSQEYSFKDLTVVMKRKVSIFCIEMSMQMNHPYDPIMQNPEVVCTHTGHVGRKKKSIKEKKDKQQFTRRFTARVWKWCRVECLIPWGKARGFGT